MPIFRTTTVTPTLSLADESIDLTQYHVGKYCYINVTAQRVLVINPALISSVDASIVIRVDANSPAAVLINIYEGGFINVNNNLGQYIPAGGVAEIKRRGGSNVFDLYGYIES